MREEVAAVVGRKLGRIKWKEERGSDRKVGRRGREEVEVEI